MHTNYSFEGLSSDWADETHTQNDRFLHNVFLTSNKKVTEDPRAH